MSLKLVLEKLASKDPEDRRGAVVTLAKSRDPRALPYLRQVADEDAEAELRYLARKAMQYVGNAPSPPPAPAPTPAPSPVDLATDLESPDRATRLAAAKAATRVKSEGMAELLSDRLRQEEDPQIVATLLVGVAAGGDESCLDAVVPWLKHQDPRIRANAVEALGALGSERAFVYLMDHLRDPDNRCRANAVLALRKSGRANVYRTLETMLGSDSVSMQDSATYCLGQMGQGPEVYGLLAKAMKSPYAVIRNQVRAVLRRLAERGADRAGEILARVGAADEAEAAEDLFARARLATPAQEPPREDPGERAVRLRRELEALKGAGVAAGSPHQDRAARVAESLRGLKDLRPEPPAPGPDPLVERLAGLKGLPPGPREGERRAETLADRLKALAGLGTAGVDPRKVREERLYQSLKSLAS